MPRFTPKRFPSASILLGVVFFAFVSCFLLLSHTHFPLLQPPDVKGSSSCHLSGDIMLITDISNSMHGQKLQDAVNAAKSFVDIVASYTNGDRIGLTTFAFQSTLNNPLTTDYASVKSSLDSLGNTPQHTCTQCGVDTGDLEIHTNGRPGVPKIAILLTDGLANFLEGWPDTHAEDSSQGEAGANTAVDHAFSQDGLIFFTIGVGKDVNSSFLQGIADRTGGSYYFSPTSNQLQKIYQQISQTCPTPPPPTPTGGTPTPTLSGSGTNTIAGSVYVDYLNNGEYTPPKDSIYTNTPSIIDVYTLSGTLADEVTTADGTYQTVTLPDGTYNVSYTSLPSGYFITVPQIGPPPTFQVTVGKGTCNSGPSLDAYCVNGNVKDLNFGITNIKPWFQSMCGDIRQDKNGVTDPLPFTPSCGGVTGSYVINTNSTCSDAGVVFSGNASHDFGNGQASSVNFLAGNPINPEVFHPASGQVIRTSYEYLIATAKQSGITPVELDDGTPSHICDASNCTLPANLPHGLYHTGGDLHLNAFSVPKNSNYVILVGKDTYIKGKISMDPSTNSTFTLSSGQDIHVLPGVGVVADTDPSASLAGFYSADRSVIIEGTGSCSSGIPDRRLNIEGAIIANAALKNGTLQNNRDLCIGNFDCPVISFVQREDLIMNSPSFVRHKSSTFQELAP